MAWLFDEISTGVTLEEQDYVVTAAELESYGTLTETNTGKEASIPPSLATPLAQFKAASPDTWPEGTLHAEQEYRYVSPLRPDVTYRLRISIDDKYEKRGRKFVVLRTEFIDPQASVPLETRSVLLWAK